jgi:predicted transcriptional regulator
MFIRSASHMSYQQLLIRKALAGEPIARFMHRDPVTVRPSASVRELVSDYFYRYHYKMFPVANNGTVIGCVTTKQVREVPASQWDNERVQDILISCSPETTVSPDTDAMKALSLMNRTGNSRLMVVEDDHLVGVITLKDMLKFLSLKVDLGGE